MRLASASAILPISAYSSPSQKLDLPDPFGPYMNAYGLSSPNVSERVNPRNGPIVTSISLRISSGALSASSSIVGMSAVIDAPFAVMI